MTAIWSFPTRILFGEGACDQLSAEAKRLGVSRAFVISDGAIEDAGTTTKVCQALKDASVAVEQFTGVSSNPRQSEVKTAQRLCEAFGADVVVGVGGGSVLDTAKLARSPGTAEGEPAAERASEDTVAGQSIPLIAIPTTSGTGSEVSAAAILGGENGRKHMLRDPQLMPTVAILDPVLTATMPPELTAASGFDAIAHCIEAYCAVGDHPMADAVALDGLKLAVKHLPRAVADGNDLAARSAMMKAGMMGGVAMQKGLGACHALADALSAHFDLHHGRGDALCLPAVLDFNRSTIPARIARIARLLCVRGDDEETLAFECSGALRALRKKVSLPDSLSEVGVPESELSSVAATAYENSVHASNPRDCTQDDFAAMLRASF